MDKKPTSSDIRAALSVKFCQPEYVIFWEVSNATGLHARRHADAVAMSIWPSRGYTIHGFEIKVSRSDFIAEMKDPTKADAVGEFCDFWWLVTPAGLVHPNELPENWGLMELTGAGLRVKKQAPKTPAAPLSRGFAAALLRRTGNADAAHIQAGIAKANAERDKRFQAAVDRETRRLRDDLAEQKQWRADFETAFGMPVKNYSCPADIALHIKVAEKIGGKWGEASLAEVKRHADALSTAIAEMTEPTAEALL